MKKSHWLWMLCSILIVTGLVSLWFYVNRSDDLAAPYTNQFGEDFEKSNDLEGDLKLMWQTERLGGTPDPTHGPNPRASTDAAIDAASRLFNTIELVGKTRKEVIAAIGDPKSSNDSTYNFPFWPAPPGAMVYRFDCGAYGWQFNVILDRDGKVREVQRAWIH